MVTPVMLRPGLASLAAKPVRTGSANVTKTTGMVVIAALATLVARVPEARITSTFGARGASLTAPIDGPSH
jgi:hypothetical protein